MNFTGLFIEANNATAGWFGVATPFLIALIAYAQLSIFGFSRAASSAMFIAMLSALPLFALGVINQGVIILIFVLTLVTMVLEFKS